MLCAGAVLLYKFYTLEPAEQGDIAPIAKGRLVKPEQRRYRPNTENQKPRLLSARARKKIDAPKVSIKKQIEIKSQISKRRFNKQTFLKVPLPGHLNYIDVDIEDGVKTIYGYNSHSKEALTAAARPGPTTIEEVRQYMKEESDAIPNLNGKKLSNFSEPQSIPGASRKKGISQIDVMSADTDDGQKVHFALVNRKDKKGSYVFVYTAPPGRLDSNDGYLDKIFSQIEAMDPPQKSKK